MDDSLKKNYANVFDSRIGFGEKPALVVIDFVRSYSDPTLNSHFFCEGVLKAVDESVELLELARNVGIPVIFTASKYQQAGIDGGTFVKKMPIALTFREGAPGAAASGEIDHKLARRENELLVYKQGASVFFATPLASVLTAARIDTLIMIGCSTSGCVRASVVDAVQHGFRPIVPRECVGDRHIAPHEANLFDIHAKYGDVLAKSEVMTYLRKLPMQSAPQ